MLPSFLNCTAFAVAPVFFGLDKFFNVRTDWTVYLAPVATAAVPVSAQVFMYGVGAVEVRDFGLLVAPLP